MSIDFEGGNMLFRDSFIFTSNKLLRKYFFHQLIVDGADSLFLPIKGKIHYVTGIDIKKFKVVSMSEFLSHTHSLFKRTHQNNTVDR